MGQEGPSMYKWENVHIFISSTFNDMHAERDFLLKKVFPELSEWMKTLKLNLIDVDLRGIFRLLCLGMVSMVGFDFLPPYQRPANTYHKGDDQQSD